MNQRKLDTLRDLIVETYEALNDLTCSDDYEKLNPLRKEQIEAWQNALANIDRDFSALYYIIGD